MAENETQNGEGAPMRLFSITRGCVVLCPQCIGRPASPPQEDDAED